MVRPLQRRVGQGSLIDVAAAISRMTSLPSTPRGLGGAGAPRPPLPFTPVAERSGTLPSHYYSDPGIHAREIEEIWFKTWQFVGHTVQLQAPGDFFTADMLDQKILVCRGKDGRIRAFHNVCRHRGHILVEGAGNRTTFTCPFHAWTYDLGGSLKAAGNAENVAGFRHEDFGLAEIRTETLANMVFVNLDAGAAPLADLVPGLEADIRGSVPDYDALKLVRTDVLEVKANWKSILDGLECYHCPVIHPHISTGAEGFIERRFVGEEHDYWQKHTSYGNRTVIERHRERLPYDLGPATVLDIPIYYLWPNLIMIAHQGPSNFKILRAVPDGPERAWRINYNFCLNDPPSAHDLAQMNQYRDVVWPQDRAAMEGQALGLKSRGFVHGRLMVDAEHSWRSEHGTHHFNRLVWRALNGDRYEV